MVSNIALLLIVGVMPMVLYAILEAKTSLKTTIISSLGVGITIEIGLSYLLADGIDWVTVGFAIFLIIMGGIALLKGNPMYFKIQPAIVSLAMALILIGSSLVGKPLLVLMFEKYEVALQNMAMSPSLSRVKMIALFTSVNLSTGVAFLLHSPIMLYTALKMSKWWWVACRAVLIWIMVIMAMIYSQVSVGIVG